MSDYISREQAIKVVRGMRRSTGVKEIPYEYAEEEIGYLPSADVRENIHGEWIHYNDEFYSPDRLAPVLRHIVECSVCHHKIADFHGLMYFCTNCGADMRGKAE